MLTRKESYWHKTCLIQTVKKFSQSTESLIGPTFSISFRSSKDIFSVYHWLMPSFDVTLSSIDKIGFHNTLFNWSNQICQPLKHIFIFNVNKYSINRTKRALLSSKMLSNVYDVCNNQLLFTGRNFSPTQREFYSTIT